MPLVKLIPVLSGWCATAAMSPLSNRRADRRDLDLGVPGVVRRWTCGLSARSNGPPWGVILFGALTMWGSEWGAQVVNGCARPIDDTLTRLSPVPPPSCPPSSVVTSRLLRLFYTWGHSGSEGSSLWLPKGTRLPRGTAKSPFQYTSLPPRVELTSRETSILSCKRTFLNLRTVTQ